MIRNQKSTKSFIFSWLFVGWNGDQIWKVQKSHDFPCRQGKFYQDDREKISANQTRRRIKKVRVKGQTLHRMNFPQLVASQEISNPIFSNE